MRNQPPWAVVTARGRRWTVPHTTYFTFRNYDFFLTSRTLANFRNSRGPHGPIRGAKVVFLAFGPRFTTAAYSGILGCAATNQPQKNRGLVFFLIQHDPPLAPALPKVRTEVLGLCTRIACVPFSGNTSSTTTSMMSTISQGRQVQQQSMQSCGATQSVMQSRSIMRL